VGNAGPGWHDAPVNPISSRGLVAALAVSALLMMAGCSGAGGVNAQQTPGPAVPNAMVGVAADAADHSTTVRDLLVVYPGQSGYQAGGVAPLTVKLGNNTDKPVTLTDVTTPGGSAVVLVGGAVASATPGAKEFEVLVPPGGLLLLAPEAGRYLAIRCLPTALTPDMTVKLTFLFDNGAKVTAAVPMGAPFDRNVTLKPLTGQKGAKPGQAC
jgi:copper(I)-binding protein